MNLCRYWGVSRQAFYKPRESQELKGERRSAIVEAVKNLRKEHVRLGTLKIRHELGEQIRACGRGFGRDKFFKLLGQEGLLLKRRRRYSLTTNSNHAYYKHTNQLAGATISAPDQAWVSDITYLRTKNRFVYLSLVTDVYSRMIVGWNVDSSLAVEGAMAAAKMALRNRGGKEQLIHHSDRGIQYCCKAYNDLMKGVVMSMGEVGNCYDNAIAERVNGILKDEYLLDDEFIDQRHATKAVEQAVYLYNYKRPHWSLDLRKPAQVYGSTRQGDSLKDAGLAPL
jgi:transposase InsO family protein